MKKRQHRATSKAAHDSIKEHKSIMYDKIKIAFERLKIGGTFEELSRVAGLKPDQVWKRLPEMVELGMVYNVGITRPTSSGRKAMVRQLVGLKGIEVPLYPKTKEQEKAAKTLHQLKLFVQ